MFRVAKVQAELKAQVKDQQIVNRICHRPDSIELIDLLYRHAYYRKRRDVSFLIVSAIMVQLLNNPDTAKDERLLCYKILNERYLKMRTDRDYCINNFKVIADIEEALMSWEKESKTSI